MRINKTLRKKGIRKPQLPKAANVTTQIETPEQNLMPDTNKMMMQMGPKIKPHPNWVKI